jgi:hypothetical protein
VNKTALWLMSGSALAALVLQARPVFADLGACNDVFVSAQAKCEVIPPTLDCNSHCTPLTVTAVCSARLAASCDASCDKLPSVDCSGTCMASCSGDCTVNPGKFDCQGVCEADCGGHCDASCKSKADGTQCMADCEGSCSVSCKKSCDVQLPSADCNAKCKASCDGSCKVETNLDCQVDCQAKGYASCQADVMGGCQVACKGKEGALFCDNQFVDVGDNLQMCIDALKQRFNVTVEASSSGTSSCDAGNCTTQGKASVNTKCSVTQPGSGHAGWLTIGVGLGLVAWSTRRRRQRR